MSVNPSALSNPNNTASAYIVKIDGISESRIKYMLNCISVSSTKKYKGGNINTSAGINLEQNQPNPYSGTTTIHYSIPAGFSSAHLVVTDYSGKKVKDYTITEGSGTINIDAARWSSGAYNYSIVVDGKISETKKMVIAR